LRDDRYKSWIRKVSFDDTLFHCIICNKNFSCSSSHVSRHADSARHRKNSKQNIFSYSDDDGTSKVQTPRKKMFQQQRLEIDKFKPWLREVPHNDILFFCLSCDKTITADLSYIYRQAVCTTHIKQCAMSGIEVSKSAEIRYAAQLEEKCKYLQTLACPCHAIALIAHAACAKIPAFCDDFFKKLVYLLIKFQDFTECFQQSSHKILKLANTRWLSRRSCISRLLEYWVIHYAQCRYKSIFLFLDYILNFFNIFNAYFQAEKTRIYLLQPKLFNLLADISRNFLKPEIVRILPNIRDILFRAKSKTA
ncbi:hypothetical protein X777_16585, partial [Ooceraea biroi]